MLPERGTFKDDLRPAFLVIMKDALHRVSHTKKFRLWRYESLAALYGVVGDWMADGKIRNAMYGADGRHWLRNDFRLWWKSDDARHTGLLFTADCRTGMEWERARIADRTHRDGIYLVEACGAATRLQPSFRAHFHKIETGAKRLIDGGEKLKAMGNGEILRRLGVSNGADVVLPVAKE